MWNMTDYRLKTPKGVEKLVTGTYEKIRDGVVDTYEKIENTVVGSYQKIEDKFVDTFLEKAETDRTVDKKEE